jgi:prepilin-type processing-associated H-X9-DG protein
MRRRAGRGGFTIPELAISLALIVLLLAVLLPALSTARVVSYRERCASNVRQIGGMWFAYMEDHDDHFPRVRVQPSWHYGGVRFSPTDGRPFVDYQRPLAPYVPWTPDGTTREELFRCPADRGITGEYGEVGTGSRTAYRSFGTSYRANSKLLDAQLAGVSEESRPLARSEVTTAPSRLLVLGCPVWYEVMLNTGRDASWHGPDHKGNFLFLDGSVHFMATVPQPRVGPIVIDPISPGAMAPRAIGERRRNEMLPMRSRDGDVGQPADGD